MLSEDGVLHEAARHALEDLSANEALAVKSRHSLRDTRHFRHFLSHTYPSPRWPPNRQRFAQNLR